MATSTPLSALACVLALSLGILLLVVPWSNDPDSGSRTYWDRHEGPREDGERISNDVWHEPEMAPVVAALALVAAVVLLLPCSLLAVSGGPTRDGSWKRWALVAGALLIVAAIAWMQGPWRNFGAGPVLATGAGILALWSGASPTASAAGPTHAEQE